MQTARPKRTGTKLLVGVLIIALIAGGVATYYLTLPSTSSLPGDFRLRVFEGNPEIPSTLRPVRSSIALLNGTSITLAILVNATGGFSDFVELSFQGPPTITGQFDRTTLRPSTATEYARLTLTAPSTVATQRASFNMTVTGISADRTRSVTWPMKIRSSTLFISPSTGTANNPSEPVAYDNNNNNQYDTGEPAVAGTAPVGAILVTDPKIRYVDSTNDDSWSSTETVVYDANDNVAYDQGEPVVAGTLPALGTNLENDPRVKFSDENANNIWNTGDTFTVQVKARNLYDLIGFEFRVGFNASLFRARIDQITIAPDFSGLGGFVVPPVVDNSTGIVSLAATLVGDCAAAGTCISVEGTNEYSFASITFDVIARGRVVLTLSNDILAEFLGIETAIGSIVHHTVGGKVNEADFSINSNRLTVIMNTDRTDSTSITVIPFGGFSNGVTLTHAVSPTGPTVSLSDTFLVSGAGTSTLNISTTGTPPGVYLVTVAGTSGLLSHSVTIRIIVT